MFNLFNVFKKSKPKKRKRPPNVSKLADAYRVCYQTDDYSCGPRSVQMVCNMYGIKKSYADIYKGLKTDKNGTVPSDIVKYLGMVGLDARRETNLKYKDLKSFVSKGVAIVEVDGDHVAVVHGVSGETVYINDPSPVRCPTKKLSKGMFLRRWDKAAILIKEDAPDVFVTKCIETNESVEIENETDYIYSCPSCGEDMWIENGNIIHD